MLYSILKTSINITLVKEETGTTPYLYYIRARRGADEKFPKKIRKGEKSRKRARERHAQEKGKTCLRQSPFYVFRPKNIRSWSQKRTVLGRKTYGLGTKNVRSWYQKRKKETSETKKLILYHKHFISF